MCLKNTLHMAFVVQHKGAFILKGGKGPGSKETSRVVGVCKNVYRRCSETTQNYVLSGTFKLLFTIRIYAFFFISPIMCFSVLLQLEERIDWKKRKAESE